jgi:hypothetical protein
VGGRAGSLHDCNRQQQARSRTAGKAPRTPCKLCRWVLHGHLNSAHQWIELGALSGAHTAPRRWLLPLAHTQPKTKSRTSHQKGSLNSSACSKLREAAREAGFEGQLQRAEPQPLKEIYCMYVQAKETDLLATANRQMHAERCCVEVATRRICVRVRTSAQLRGVVDGAVGGVGDCMM